MAHEETIIFDIDGTAINSPASQEPSKRLVTAIGDIEKSRNLCAATGRVWSFASPVLRALNLRDPCIVSAGTQICDPRTGEVLWQSNIETGHMHDVVDIISQLPGYKLLYNDYDEHTYFSNHSMPLALALQQPVYFLALIFVPEAEASEVVARLRTWMGLLARLHSLSDPDATTS